MVLPTTHRQHAAFVEWLEWQWNEPDRTDHYLMQLAALWTKDRSIEDMKIPFIFKRAPDAVNSDDFRRGGGRLRDRDDAKRSIRAQQAVIVPPGAKRRTAEEAEREPTPFDLARKRMMEETGARTPLEALELLNRQREQERREREEA